jgi:hypothetical protein
MNERIDPDTDVLVIGTGLAGGAAAWLKKPLVGGTRVDNLG